MKKKIIGAILSVLVIVFLIGAIIGCDMHTSTNIKVIEVNSPTLTQVEFQIDDYNRQDSLFFYSNSTKIEVYFDEFLVETFTSDLPAKHFYSIDLYDDVSNVKIVLSDINGMLIEINEVYVGTYSELSIHLLIKDGILLCITLLMFFTSILIMILGLYFLFLKQKATVLIGYTLFFIMSSLWCLVQVDFIINLFDGDVLYLIQHYAIYSFGISVALISMIFSKNKKNIIAGILIIALFLLIPIICFVLSTFGIYILEIMNFIAIGLTIAYFIGIIIMTKLIDNVETNKYGSIYSQSLIICCIGLAVEFGSTLTRESIGPSGMYFAICLLFVYIFSISRLVKEYVKKENDRTHLSEENARLSSSILLSQIKPHFLYNALNSISYLCKRDPKQADMAVIRFSRYLRQNMKCIESSELVDFASEMEHVRNYVYLEQIRFPKMEVVYELKYINFQVPPLCIQPIVENAVKHGVSKNTDGGYVLIKSFATAKHIIIEVSDNGPGFDTKMNIKGTGLSNISRRLKMIIEADIEFGSVVGKGTVVRVRIPRKDVK